MVQLDRARPHGHGFHSLVSCVCPVWFKYLQQREMQNFILDREDPVSLRQERELQNE